MKAWEWKFWAGNTLWAGAVAVTFITSVPFVWLGMAGVLIAAHGLYDSIKEGSK